MKSWAISDAFWAKVEPLIPVASRAEGRQYLRKPGGGRKPMPPRQIFSAIVYVLRTGCQWKALPREYGSASAVHLHFQKWQEAGFFLRLWRAGLAEYDEMEAIAWNWQSIDGAMHKAPLATECVGPNPTDCWDNACSETLFSSLKVERLHGQRFQTIREAKDEVIAWLLWYNRTRMHSTLGYHSPAEFEQLWRQEQLKAAA